MANSCRGSTKTCTKCLADLSISEFNKQTRRKDGLDYWCKQCCKEYFRRYRLANLEKIKKYNSEYNKNYSKFNKEKLKAYQKEYYKQRKTNDK